MATREEVKAAHAEFGEWFPRHGVLRTSKSDLYVALHQALERKDVERRQLVLLGNKLKKALSERPREELRILVKKTEAIHNKEGLEEALAHLHKELASPEVEEKPKKGETPVASKTIEPSKSIFQRLKAAKFAGRPSERLDELELILKRNHPKALTRGLNALLTRRQDNLLRTARKSGKVETMARTILALSEKTNVPVGEVRTKLLGILDKVHEIDEDQPPHVNDIFARLAETGSIQNKAQLARVIKLFRNAASRLDRKMKEINARTGAVETPTVFSETLTLITEASKSGTGSIPLNSLAAIIAARVKHYEANAGVSLEEIPTENFELEEDTT